MIITRTPLRISIGGGGTDLPSYYERRGGLLHLGRHRPLRVHRHQRHVHRRLRDQVLGARAGRRRRRHRPPPRPRGPAPPPDRRRQGDREHRRHPGRHRARLLGGVHRRPAAGPARPPARARVGRRAGRGGVPHRDRRARRARRQAGPVHRRLRWPVPLRGRPRRHGRRHDPRRDHRHAPRPRGAPAAVLHGLLAPGRRGARRPEAAVDRGRRRDARPTWPRPRRSDGASARRSSRARPRPTAR